MEEEEDNKLEENEYEVEEICERKGNKYLVKWKGYLLNRNSIENWITVKNSSKGTKIMIKEFNNNIHNCDCQFYFQFFYRMSDVMFHRSFYA